MPCAVEDSGHCLAVLTTLVRLLEVKLAELEGEGGTGPLEDDVALLEAASRQGEACLQSSFPSGIGTSVSPCRCFFQNLL